MVWVPNQAIRSAVGLPFEIVKVLRQEHSCWTKSTRRSRLLESRKHSYGERQAAGDHRERKPLHRDRYNDTDDM
jgi:hypothetical protein